MAEVSDTDLSEVKRACAACRRRKVKCIGDGTGICKSCSSLALVCTYAAPRQKKGPKGSRANIIKELRQAQGQSQTIVREITEETVHPIPSRSPALLLTSMELVTTCAEYFSTHVYPTQPIWDGDQIKEALRQMDSSTEAYCAIGAMCAYTTMQLNLVVPYRLLKSLPLHPGSKTQLGHILLQETARVRKYSEYVDNPTALSVITSLFLFYSSICLERQNMAFFHLREACTLAQAVGMNGEGFYVRLNLVEKLRMIHLHWVLCITEKICALQQCWPLTLHTSIDLPSSDGAPNETVELKGFTLLMDLFRPFNGTFMEFWNNVRTGATTEWLTRLQQQLSNAVLEDDQSTESQALNLKCSQQWLRTIVWRLSNNQGHLSSTAVMDEMSFTFPVQVSRDLLAATNQFSQHAMEILGIGLIKKLVDIACTLVYVTSCAPREQRTFEYGPSDYLSGLASLISSLPGGQQYYTAKLASKIGETMPNASIYGLSLPCSSRVVGRMYHHNHDASDVCNAPNPTPRFDNPPFDVAFPQPLRSFKYLVQDVQSMSRFSPDTYSLEAASIEVENGNHSTELPFTCSTNSAMGQPDT